MSLTLFFQQIDQTNKSLNLIKEMRRPSNIIVINEDDNPLGMGPIRETKRSPNVTLD